MAIGTRRIEDYVPVVKYNEGIYSELSVTFATGAVVTLPSTTTIGGSSVVALGDITSSSTSATAFSVTNSGIFTGASVVTFVANSATTGTIFLLTANGLTTGHLVSLTSSATLVTTGDMLSIVANTATTSTGLVRVSGTGLTDGFVMALTGGGANATASGGVLNIATGAATAGAALAITNASGIYAGTGIFTITANSMTTGVMALLTSSGVMTTTGSLLTLTANGATTAAGLLRINANGLTDGIGLIIASSATASTSTGRLMKIVHTGVTSTSGILTEFISAANDETVLVKITASDINALGTSLAVSTATTTGNGITVTANAITDGFGISVTSSNTTMSSTGRLLNISHSGNAGVSAVIAEVKSAGADETVVMQVLASGLLAAGKVLNLSAAAMTTGTVLSAANADALTTGMVAQFKSNSADATARTLVDIHNDHASAAGTIPLKITQDAPTSTNFKLMMTLGTMQIFVSDQTSPNTALTATEGSLCLNGSATGQIFWNTDGSTAWTVLA